MNLGCANTQTTPLAQLAPSLQGWIHWQKVIAPLKVATPWILSFQIPVATPACPEMCWCFLHTINTYVNSHLLNSLHMITLI